MKTQSLLICGMALASNAYAGTVLVNFSATGSVIATTAADYAVADANVELATTVVDLVGNADTTATGTDLTINVSEIASPAFDQSFDTRPSGAFTTSPITDSYRAGGVNAAPLAFTLSGLEEFAVGTPLTLTVYAVGDNNDQDGNLTFTHDGGVVGTGSTEADGTGLAYVSATFNKGAGDTILIENVNATQFKAINGFSLTGEVIPEPSSALLVGLSALALVGRRRK